MANDEGVDPSKGDSDGKNSSIKDVRSRTRRNIEELLFTIDVDDIFYFCISFLSTFVVFISIIAVGFPYYEVEVNIQPVSESFINDLDCSSQDQSGVCSMDAFATRYTLFHRQVNYFHFAPTFGVSFCESNNRAYTFLQNAASPESYFGADEIPDETKELLGGNNIGECSNTALILAGIFAYLTSAFAVMGLLWATVIMKHYGSTKVVIIHVALVSATCLSSLATICIFWIHIDPSRLNPTFCDRQTAFSDCDERLGQGFYCQVATVALSFLQLLVYALKMYSSMDSKTLYCCGKNRDQDPEELQAAEEEQNKHTNSSSQHHIRFYKNPHFYIKLGRFLEFFLATVSVLTNFTTLELLLPDNDDDTPISMYSYLWGDQFCNDNNFIIDLLRFEQDGDTETSTDLKNFGDCKIIYKYKILFSFFKIVAAGGSALFMKRNAATNPLSYLVGICADFGTIVLAIISIVIFMTKIYPGRSSIEPSFCDQFGDLLVDDSGDIGSCKINVGIGFYLLCVIALVTVVNLVAEFTVSEDDSKYGAINAFHTVVNRLRAGRFRDAVYQPASFIVRESEKPSDAIESKKDDHPETDPPENHDEAP